MFEFDLLRWIVILVIMGVICGGSTEENIYYYKAGSPILGGKELKFSSRIRPHIGVLTKPTSDNPFNFQGKDLYREVAEMSYASLILGSGALTLYVSYQLPKEDLENELGKLNGIIIQDGFMDFCPKPYGNPSDSKYLRTIGVIAEYSTTMKSYGSNFPILALGKGMQAIALYYSKNCSIMADYSSVLFSANLMFHSYGRLYELFSKESKEQLADQNIAPFRTKQIIPQIEFENNPKLSEKFTLLTTSRTSTNENFISSFEGIYLPIFGIQFLPNMYFSCRTTTNIEYSQTNMKIFNTFGYFMKNESSLNNHYMSGGQVDNQLIWNGHFSFSGRNTCFYLFDYQSQAKSSEFYTYGFLILCVIILMFLFSVEQKVQE